MNSIRIGHGYDVHALGEGDGFVLGGVRIPYHRAIIAFSDGDVLIHALCDALLGALGERDIGFHFADTLEQNRDRDSREFLRQVKSIMDDRGYRLGNVDVTIVAQAPKMAAHLDQMMSLLAGDMGCRTDQINIKATTTEKLGYIGRNEGIAVHAVVLLEQIT